MLVNYHIEVIIIKHNNTVLRIIATTFFISFILEPIYDSLAIACLLVLFNLFSILEVNDGRETFNIEFFCKLGASVTINLGQGDIGTLLFKHVCSLCPFRLQCLTMTTPGGVEFNSDVVVRVNVEVVVVEN